MGKKDDIELGIDDQHQLDFESDFRADQGVNLEAEKKNLQQGGQFHQHKGGHSHNGKPCNGHHNHGGRNWGIILFTIGVPIQAYILQYFWFFKLMEEDDGSYGYAYLSNLIFMIFIGIMNLQTYYYSVTIINTPIDKPTTPADKNLEDFYQNDKTCLKCTKWKPTRTSHCSSCNRCTMKMDHHCPWIDNCVGLKNHQAFLLFTTYMALGAIQYGYHSVNYFRHLNAQKNGFFEENNIFFYVYWTFVTMVIFPITLMLSGLTVFHTFSMFNNYTTLQSMAGAPPGCPLNIDQDPERSNKKKQTWINVFDQGMLKNTSQFFKKDRFFFWVAREGHPYNDGSYQEMNPPVLKSDFMMFQLGSEFPKELHEPIIESQILEKYDQEMATEKPKYKNKVFQYGDKLFEFWRDDDLQKRQLMMTQLQQQMMEQQKQFQEMMNMQQFKSQEEMQAFVKDYQQKMMIQMRQKQEEQQQIQEQEQQKKAENQEEKLNQKEDENNNSQNEENQEQLPQEEQNQDEIDLLDEDSIQV